MSADPRDAIDDLADTFSASFLDQPYGIILGALSISLIGILDLALAQGHPLSPRTVALRHELMWLLGGVIAPSVPTRES